MRAIVIQDSDAANLLDLLKLEQFKEERKHTPQEYAIIDKVHRRFHYIVCRWLQEQGANVVR